MKVATKTSPSALDEYLRLHLLAIEKANAILAALEDHQDEINPDHVHWGHVGDLTSAIEQMDEILSRLA
ncbi:MAG: hypothetical protein ACLQUT_06280 [Thermoleophilia bacterium]